MSEKQMEKNLNYGDSNNLFCFFSDLLKSLEQTIEKSIDATAKKV
jgi:hypothetical protein